MKKKRTGGSNSNSNSNSSSNSNHVNSFDSSRLSKPIVNAGVDFDASIFFKCAHDLKDEGNKKFQGRYSVGALENNEDEFKLIPKKHPDRVLFHRNIAACLMQMKPVDYESVISECSLALKAQPGFTRALLRRARAFEGVGKFDLFAQVVNVLLGSDPNHKDA